jgi:hypothetical protein
VRHPHFFKAVVSLFLLFGLFHSKLGAASVFFDFIPSTYLISRDGKLQIDFKYDLTDISIEAFNVRPVLGNGHAEILNEDTGVWINASDSWTTMPKLKDKMHLRLTGIGVQKTTLMFQVYWRSTKKVYETPGIPIWNLVYYKSYFKNINENLAEKQEAVVTDEMVNETTEAVLPEKKEKTNPTGGSDTNPELFSNNRLFLFVDVGLFTLAAVVGFVISHAKIHKCKG